MKKRNRTEGYFSVEAALVLPMVLSVYVFLIAMLLLQYDRCQLEQDMASMMIKAVNYPGTPHQKLAYMQELSAGWDREGYLWLQPQVPHFTIQGQQIRLNVEGIYTVPVYTGIGNIGGEHRLEVSYQLTAWDRAAAARMLAAWRLREEKVENQRFSTTD